MIRLPEIKTAELSTYGYFAKCRQAHFRVSRVGLGTRLLMYMQYAGRGHAYVVSIDDAINFFPRSMRSY